MTQQVVVPLAPLAPLTPAVGAACSRCATELSPAALACPACHALVHTDALKAAAADAERLTGEGALVGARASWMKALELLPVDAPQRAHIDDAMAELTRRIERESRSAGIALSSGGTSWKKWSAALATVAILLLGKLKFLVLGLTKLKTFVSMFAFFGVYWSTYGWPLALGLVISIYIHEMGHVAMIRRLGLEASAPLFIPGIGAFIRLRQHIQDAVTDARVGLAGPEWGLAAAVAAYAGHLATGKPIWLAIAQLGALLNLFNLMPIWSLDGSRAFHALDRIQRWLVVAAIALAFALSGQKLLLLVGAVAVWRSFQPPTSTGDRRTLVTFLVLIGAFTWLASLQPLRASGA